MTSLPLEYVLLNCSRGAVEFAANWMLQSTVLLAIGLLIGRLLRRQGSAAQSLVYRTTLAVVLICPLAAWSASACGISGWSVELPFAHNDVVHFTEGTGDVESRWRSAADAARNVSANSKAGKRAAGEQMTRISRSDSGQSSSPTPTRFEPVDTGNREHLARLFPSSLDDCIAICLCLMWFVISGWLCMRLARAWAVMRAIRSGASPADVSLNESCQRLAGQLGVRVPQVRYSPFIPSPCLTGLWRPIVLLPDSDLKLSASDVLMHELAHLKRRDLQWNLLRETATAIFFFQPLLWKLSRRMEETAEEVCDDFVVHYGGDRRDYANGLVDVAQLTNVPAAAAVAIVSLRSTLAGRIARIMDTSRELSTRANRLVVSVTLLVGIAATAVVGVMNSKSSAAANATDNAASSGIVSARPAAPALQETEKTPVPDVGVVTVSGRVLDPTGQPLPNARVWLQRVFAASLVDEAWHGEYRDGSSRGWNEWFAVTSTDSEGRFRFDVHSASWNVGHNPYATQIAATANGVGFGLATVPAVFETKEQPELIIPTAVDQPLEGRIVTSDGRPAAGTAVRVVSVRRINEPSADDYIADILAGGSKYSRYDHRSTTVPGMSAVHGQADNYLPSEVLTGSDGRFTLRGIGADRVTLLTIRGSSIPREDIRVVTRLPPIDDEAAQSGGVLRLKQPLRADPGLAAGPGMGGPSLIPDVDQYYSRFTHVGEPVRILKGVVRDQDTGEPVPGVRLHGVGIPTTSDAEGRYEIFGCRKQDRYNVGLSTLAGKYLNLTIAVSDAPGTGLLEHDFILPKAITARGRVTDRETGEPFDGTVEYNPLFPNEELERLNQRLGDNVSLIAIPRSSCEIAEDGTWELQVLPGPGILLVRGRDDEVPAGRWPVHQTWTSARIDISRLQEVLGSTEQAGRVSTTDTFQIDSGHGAFGMRASGFKSLALIRPSVDLLSDSGKVFTQDLFVVRGRDIQGIVLDPEGRPISGVTANGLALDSALTVFLKDEHFTVSCASPDAPRRLVFEHRARGLRAEVEVEPDFDGQLTVRLKPATD